MEKNTNPDVEVRMFTIELRSSDGEAPHIEGMAAVYNSWSEDLGGFREMIEPGFFENVLKQDVRALWNHNSDLVLGRTKSGTLRLEDTERGVQVDIVPPDTQTGRDALTSIGRGDVDQMSFAFSVKQGGDEWIREKDGSIKRVLKRGGAANLYDVSPVAFPAYAKTSVYVRSQLEAFNRTSQEADAAASGAAEAKVRHANRKRKIQLLSMK